MSLIRFKYQHIAIDGGSTDNTIEILNNSKPEIEVISQKSKGLYPALAEAVEHAEGDYIFFIHSDDEITEFDLDFSLLKPFRVLYGKVEFCRGRNVFTRNPPVFLRSWLKHFPFIVHPNALYPRDFFREFPFDPLKWSRKADMMQIAEASKMFDFFRYHGICYRFNVDGGGVTAAAAKNKKEPRSFFYKFFLLYVFVFFENARFSRILGKLSNKPFWS